MQISNLKFSDLPLLLHNKSTLKTYTSFLKDIDIPCGLQSTASIMNQLDAEHKSHMKANVIKALKAVAKACVEKDATTRNDIDASLLNTRAADSCLTMNSKSPAKYIGDHTDTNIALMKNTDDVVLTDVESDKCENVDQDDEFEQDDSVVSMKDDCKDCVFWKNLMRECIPYLPEKQKEDLALLFLNRC